VKIGLEFGEFGWAGGPAKAAEVIARFARTADDAGVDLLGVGDHLWQGPQAGGPEQPYLECFTALTVMAVNSSRARLAPVVAGVHFREPAVLANAITSLDVLSGGRAVLGVGVGWDADESAGMGIAFPPVAERFERLEETLEICLQMWSENDGGYDGKHYQLAETLCVPQPVSTPRPRILIGGGGEKKTLRLVAKYADACNLFGDADMVRHKVEVLHRHCEDVGRDPSEIEVTVLFRDVPDSPDGLLRAAEAMRTAGVGTLVASTDGPDPARHLEETWGPVLDRFREL
jgi:F420-dependent oxidoreductase-like protein